MKREHTATEIEEIKHNGGTIPTDAIVKSNAPKEYKVPEKEYKWISGADPKTPEEIEEFFYSPEIEKLKKLIVDLGRRSYGKNYNDGNGGNFTVRVGDNIVLCTPTMISKGSMTTEDMCFVDMDGNQLAGKRKRTSEVLAHLAIMKRQPMAKACCHAHPPHATAYALAGKTPPRCVNPETEIFIGQVGLADYGTPGTQYMADAVGVCGVDHDCVFMVNHGVMTWANDIETAFWKMENVEAHCYTSMLAYQLGGPKKFSNTDATELVKIRKAMGMVNQEHLPESKFCDSSAESCADICEVSDNDIEKLVAKITKMVISELKR